MGKKKKQRKENQHGLTIVYTGDGKGKTTAALGLAMRMLGAGKKVSLIQFMKSKRYSEHAILEKLPCIDVTIMGKGFCKCEGDTLPIKEHKKATQKALSAAKEAISSDAYDMVILDEVNCSIMCKLLAVREVLKLIRAKPKHIHLVLTGRGAPKSIIKTADLVSEIKDLKHPFYKGIKAQEGIEY